LPNIISTARLVIAPVLFFSIKADDLFLITLLAAFAIFTDFLDGLLARKLNSITDAGKILDPLADKLCVVGAASAAFLYGDLPFTLFLIIMARDIIIAVVGVSLIKIKRKIPVYNIWGKITVTVFSAALIVYVYQIAALYTALFWLVFTFALISLISYFFVCVKFISCKA